jgi:hypothetical protein
MKLMRLFFLAALLPGGLRATPDLVGLKRYTKTVIPLNLRFINKSRGTLQFSFRMRSLKKPTLETPPKVDLDNFYKKFYSCSRVLIVSTNFAAEAAGVDPFTVLPPKAYRLKPSVSEPEVACLIIEDWNAFVALDIYEYKAGKRAHTTTINKRDLHEKRQSTTVWEHRPCQEYINITYKAWNEYEIDPDISEHPEVTCKPRFPLRGV